MSYKVPVDPDESFAPLLGSTWVKENKKGHPDDECVPRCCVGCRRDRCTYCCCFIKWENVLETVFVSLCVFVAWGQLAYTPLTFLIADLCRNVWGPTLLTSILLVYIPCICVRTRPRRRTRFRKCVNCCMVTSVCLLLAMTTMLIPDAVELSSQLAADLDIKKPSEPSIEYGKPFYASLALWGPHWENAGSYEAQTFVYKSRNQKRDESYECGFGSRDWSSDLELDVYLPEDNSDSNSPSPVLFHIHGGAWRVCDKSVAAWSYAYFLERGYAIVSPQYSLVCHGYDVNDMVQDLRDSISFLRNNNRTQTLNLDMNRVHVVGDSAGAHLGLLMTTKYPESYFLTVFNNYGPTDLANWRAWWWSGLGFDQCNKDAGSNTNGGGLLYNLAGKSCDRKDIDAISPITYVSSKTPPVVSFAGTMDSMVPYESQIMSFHDKLSEKNVLNSLVRVLGSDHVADLGYYSLPAQMQRLSMVTLFNYDRKSVDDSSL